uniref:SMODS and SLOG-associating 2TM effector domain-containing protein n=1 Tax=viral metagenome TaxID=1070528 RepID=A0A6C0JY32_9ZZZZ
MTDETSPMSISWNSQLERILCEEGERALCFSWMHDRCQKYYSGFNTMISLPVIVLSTLAGATSIGSQSLFGTSNIANVVIGGVSLGVATLNTISSYFSWAKRSESHRIAGITYAKVHRFIMIELALPRSERITAKDMLKIVREQCDRLAETSPQVPDKIIGDFKAKFEKVTNVKKPDIANGLDPIYVHPPDILSPLLITKRNQSSFEDTKISIDDHIPSKTQTLSLVHLPTESATDSNHI